MLDLFSGCGGLSLGLEASGFRPVAFAEISHEAAETYRLNRNHELVRFVRASELLHAAAGRRVRALLREMHHRELDLVCGGPPCQGFSTRGQRRTQYAETSSIPANHLYLDMVKIVNEFRPKVFLFENVAGLLHAKWNRNESARVFDDVLGAFRRTLQTDYLMDWSLLEAWRYGVPQLRRRLFLVGLRNDVARKALGARSVRLKPSGHAIEAGLLPAPDLIPSTPSPEQVIGDLVDPSYLEGLVTTHYAHAPKGEFQEQARLGVSPDALTEQVYSEHRLHTIRKFSALIRNHGVLPEKYQTKKFGLRLLPRDWPHGIPNLTITTMPDDFVHYQQPRTLTVRECARFQTFPDWYRFFGRRSTGGHQRAGRPSLGQWDRATPKYTQIGNAVPVKLAEKIGRHLLTLIRPEK